MTTHINITSPSPNKHNISLFKTKNKKDQTLEKALFSLENKIKNKEKQEIDLQLSNKYKKIQLKQETLQDNSLKNNPAENNQPKEIDTTNQIEKEPKNTPENLKNVLKHLRLSYKNINISLGEETRTWEENGKYYVSFDEHYLKSYKAIMSEYQETLTEDEKEIKNNMDKNTKTDILHLMNSLQRVEEDLDTFGKLSGYQNQTEKIWDSIKNSNGYGYDPVLNPLNIPRKYTKEQWEIIKNKLNEKYTDQDSTASIYHNTKFHNTENNQNYLRNKTTESLLDSYNQNNKKSSNNII